MDLPFDVWDLIVKNASKNVVSLIENIDLKHYPKNWINSVNNYVKSYGIIKRTDAYKLYITKKYIYTNLKMVIEEYEYKLTQSYLKSINLKSYDIIEIKNENILCDCKGVEREGGEWHYCDAVLPNGYYLIMKVYNKKNISHEVRVLPIKKVDNIDEYTALENFRIRKIRITSVCIQNLQINNHIKRKDKLQEYKKLASSLEQYDIFNLVYYDLEYTTSTWKLPKTNIQRYLFIKYTNKRKNEMEVYQITDSENLILENKDIRYIGKTDFHNITFKLNYNDYDEKSLYYERIKQLVEHHKTILE